MPSSSAAREGEVPPRGSVPETVWTKLYFGWALVWAALVTPPMAVGLLLHHLLRPTTRTFSLWLRAWARLVLFGVGIRCRADVRTALPAEQPFVVVANHQNMLDILTCAAAIPHPYGFAAKASLRRLPFIGTVIARTCVVVDRSTARRAVESVREAAALIRGGHSVLIYAEGERSYGPEVLPFLRGAFLLAVEAGVPLVPVVQLDNYTAIDERRRVARPGVVRIVVGEPIPTEGVKRGDIPALMEQVREVMKHELARFHGGRIGAADERSVSSEPPPPPGSA